MLYVSNELNSSLVFVADFSRVVLTAIDDNEPTSYINAVNIPVSSYGSSIKGKVRSRKSFSKLRKLFPRNSKIIAVLSSSLLKCDKSTLKLPLSGKDLMDIHTNHNSKKKTVLNQFLELNIAIAIR